MPVPRRTEQSTPNGEVIDLYGAPRLHFVCWALAITTCWCRAHAGVDEVFRDHTGKYAYGSSPRGRG